MDAWPDKWCSNAWLTVLRLPAAISTPRIASLNCHDDTASGAENQDEIKMKPGPQLKHRQLLDSPWNRHFLYVCQRHPISSWNDTTHEESTSWSDHLVFDIRRSGTSIQVEVLLALCKPLDLPKPADQSCNMLYHDPGLCDHRP